MSVKPCIDRTNLKNIIMKVGQMVNFDVDIIGEPPPKVQWKFGPKHIDDGDIYNINNVDYNSKFCLMKAARKDTGKYFIMATNPSGSDEAEVEITVLGKPMRPNGPLEVSDVTKEGCTLKWKKPDDDGGSPIDHYEIEKMDTETGMWVPAGHSTEPKFDVKNLVPGKNYKFRVRAVNKEGDSDELQTEKSTLAKNPFGKPGRPKGPLEVSDVHAEGCKLKWNKPEDDGGASVKEYVVEKMDTDTGRWIPVTTTKEPEAEITGLIPGKEYQFRVKAVNPEGESDPLETSSRTVAKNPFDSKLHRTGTKLHRKGIKVSKSNALPLPSAKHFKKSYGNHNIPISDYINNSANEIKSFLSLDSEEFKFRLSQFEENMSQKKFCNSDSKKDLVPVTEQLEVPYDLHHFIIRKKGKDVHSMMEQYDVNIIICPQNEHSHLITIKGLPDKVKLTKAALREIIEQLELEKQDRILKNCNKRIDKEKINKLVLKYVALTRTQSVPIAPALRTSEAHQKFQQQHLLQQLQQPGNGGKFAPGSPALQLGKRSGRKTVQNPAVEVVSVKNPEVLENLIRNGELPPSAAQEPPTPTTPETQKAYYLAPAVGSSRSNVENCLPNGDLSQVENHNFVDLLSVKMEFEPCSMAQEENPSDFDNSFL